jgi:FAD dependent oxidoreductase TIGR03364
MPSKAIVIGAGVVGLATARALAENGFHVDVYERSSSASGASIRNFGMIWPIGQRSGVQYERAMRTKAIWKELCFEMGAWFEENGSLHLAQTEQEEQAMQEIVEKFSLERPVFWVDRDHLDKLSPAINKGTVRGGLWCRDEALVESRKIIRDLPVYLQERYPIQFYFQQPITGIMQGKVWIGSRAMEADIICICSGVDFSNFFPSEYQENFTTCKLQMMRTVSQPNHWKLGPSICGGLSLGHYLSFEAALSLPYLKSQLAEKFPDYLKYGIHVMACQNHLGEITIGDSHEYDSMAEPFDSASVNQLILSYLKQIVLLPDWRIQQTWNGYYAKPLNGQTEYFKEIESGIWAINGFGGAGMTLSLGTVEELCRSMIP